MPTIPATQVAKTRKSRAAGQPGQINGTLSQKKGRKRKEGKKEGRKGKGTRKEGRTEKERERKKR